MVSLSSWHCQPMGPFFSYPHHHSFRPSCVTHRSIVPLACFGCVYSLWSGDDLYKGNYFILWGSVRSSAQCIEASRSGWVLDNVRVVGVQRRNHEILCTSPTSVAAKEQVPRGIRGCNVPNCEVSFPRGKWFGAVITLFMRDATWCR